MEHLGSYLPILAGILTITTVAAAAFAGLKMGTERTLRDSNVDLRARVSDLESERADDEAKIARLEGSIREQVGEIKLLSSMVQGRVDWTAIGDQLEEHHRQALGYWSRTEQHLAGIQTALENRK